MNISLEKETLTNALSYAQSISETNNINSYYSYFILTAEKSSIKIQSADRKSTFEFTIEADKKNNLTVEKTGVVLLPVVKTASIVQNLPPGLISIVLKNEDAVITPKPNPSEISFSMRTRSAEDYPKEVHRPMPKETYAIHAQSLYGIIYQTAFAASAESSNTSLFLTGIFFETKDKSLIAVATDRNRISISKVPVDFSFPKTQDAKSAEDRDIIVPSKTMNVIKKLIASEDGDIRLALDAERIYFQTAAITISANLIAGKYYDYAKIIPKADRNNIVVNKEALKAALNRVSLIADAKKDVPVKFTIEDSYALISSEVKEHGESSEKIPAVRSGEKASFAAKAQFVADPLSVLEGKEVLIDYGSEKRDLIKITSAEKVGQKTNSKSDKEQTIHIIAPFNI